MKSLAVVATALLGVASAVKNGRTFAVLRFNNKQLTQGRVDPIVSPGKPSGHNHIIHGGSNFGLSSTGADLMNSQCSTAKVHGDNSNYWVPTVYFHDKAAGTFESVDVDYVNAYYFFEQTHDDIVAFPVGLQMLSGNPSLRTPPANAGNVLDPSQGPIQPVQFTCPRSTTSPPTYPPGSNGMMAGMQDPHVGNAGVGFPDADCDGLYSPLRMDIHFPSCYNQQSLTDYKNNMAWPVTTDGYQDCPKDYLHVPHLFLEVYWDTSKFASRWQSGSGEQPFVLSNGDATGYGAHGDFMAAWNTTTLQKIIDGCDAGDSGMDQCPGIELNNGDCTIDNPYPETVQGILQALPGNNPVSGWQYGAAPAAPAPPAGSDPVPSNPAPANSAPPASSGANSNPPQAPAPVQTPVNSAPPAAPAAPAPTVPPKGGNNESGADCVTEIETVWETVYVTESAPAAPTQIHARQHVHNHAAHNHALRHRSFRR